MTDIKIENVIGFTHIADSLNLGMLAKVITESSYKPEEIPALVIHFDKPKHVIFLFSNGKLYFTGPKNIEEAHEVVGKICKTLNKIGITTYEKPNIQIKNIITSTDINRDIDLQSISRSLKKAEYKPKRFPGLIYKSHDLHTVIFIFDNGKIVCNISNSASISAAIEIMTKELKTLGME
jgi:TATA-box binding protein (TBP) (component of TFIID and TFIIIB)